MLGVHPAAHPDELITHRRDDGLDAIVPRRTTALLDAQCAQRKRHLVMHHDQVPLYIQTFALAELGQQLAYRVAAQVHVRLGLGQQQLFATQLRRPRERPATPVLHFHLQALGQSLDGEKAEVMRRKLVLRPRVPKTDDQLHAYFLAAGSEAASSSVSCLPFLMTSGSAGPAAAASAAASGVGASSSFTEVMCATAWSSSVMNLSLPPCGRSATRST